MTFTCSPGAGSQAAFVKQSAQSASASSFVTGGVKVIISFAFADIDRQTLCRKYNEVRSALVFSYHPPQWHAT